MCVERYFLVNLLMDFVLIGSVTRSLGCFRLSRSALAAALGGLGATAVRLTGISPPAPLAVAALFPLAALAAGCGRAAAGAGLAVNALAVGACGQRLGLRGFTLALPALSWAASLAPALRRETLCAAPTVVEVVQGRGTARFTACLDTGNRLREPLSGQPVLVANAALLKPVLPDSGFRAVAYGSVGGGGTLPCFRPERLYIWENGRRRRAPEAWIAVYPRRLPGAYQALAPAAFAFKG